MFAEGIDGIFIGARPQTQCLDIDHGMQSTIEKGLDLEGCSAIAQQDIASFYDSLPILLIAEYLVENGIPSSHVACLVCQQLCPRVIVRCGGVAEYVGRRCVGGLTGSRVTGLLGRVPVEESFASRCSEWRTWGFKLNDHKVLMACTRKIGRTRFTSRAHCCRTPISAA